jgi:ribonucleoside-diphosphate reductase alpha chain
MVTKTVTSKVVAPLATRQGLLPTPPIPEDLPRVELTENARQVLVRRYVRRGEDGEPVETPEEMFWRVAYHIAKAEEAWGGDVMTRAREFYTLLTNKKFFPNSPTFTGAGTPLGQLAACFVLPITDDMGRDSAGIFQTLRDAALIQQTGGGNGFSFSRLRPKGALVKSSAGQATGPVGFLRVYDHAFGEIAQGGTRRGANMGVLRVDHPDIEDFITCKTNENQITNFNISVGITDAFMRAVRDDAEWELRFPEVNSPEYRGLSGTLEQAEQAGVPIRVYRKVRARELFDKIVRQAHHNGEPGVLFLDAANRENPMPHLYQLESTNPCVTGDTLIYTDDGLRRADELAAEAKEIKVVTDARFGTQTLMPASHVFSTGKKNVYRLMTRQGYELRLTENHQVMSSRGWVAAGDLKPGDRIHILNRKGGFGVQGTLEEGRVLGWMVGDGTVNAIWAVLSFFGDEKRELAPAFAAMVTGIVEKPGQRRAYPVGVTEITERDEARVSSQRLRDWIAHYGLRENKFIVPAAVLTGSEDIQRGFLQALFTADGQVSGGGDKGCSVRLSSSHLALLKDVQRLLLNFGIVSRIYENRRTGGYRPMADGKGGSKEYFHLPQHDLAISKLNLIRFANEIGFLMEAKQTKLADYLNRMVRGLYDEPFLATVAAVEPDGCETVYDLHQPDAHSFIANGLVVHNCGEQFLGPYENCCLGSINLAEHCGAEGTVDWESLRRSVELSTRFLDDVVDANAYVPAVPQLKEAAHRARRIGLGIMGLADLMYHVGVRYGSAEGQEFGAQVMEFVRYHAMKTSIELAEERGPFPAIQNSIYDMEDMRWTPPKSLVKYDHGRELPYHHNWGCPPLDWEEIVEGIRSHGIRNAAQTTVAPTGTIATVAGCEGYGCEPVFALAYVRHVNDQGKDLQLTYASPRFKAALAAAGMNDTARRTIFERVMEHGTCQDIPEVPESIRHIFVVSADISAEEHVRMQAAMQAFVDNSLSKTINFSEAATQDEVAQAYMLAWELGCKGITVYVTGSREKVVLETKATANKKQVVVENFRSPNREALPIGLRRVPDGEAARSHPAGDTVRSPGGDAADRPSARRDVSADIIATQVAAWNESKKPRPRALVGRTYRVETPLGKAFITVNENGGQHPFEVFINTAKAGSETAAVSEAIGRLISYVLRLPSPIAPRDRLAEVVKQLSGIGGGRSLGFGPHRVRSLPDGVGQVLNEYLKGETDPDVMEKKTSGNGHFGEETLDEMPRQMPMQMGDLCPECGEATMVNEEGCRKCYTCGYSEC